MWAFTIQSGLWLFDWRLRIPLKCPEMRPRIPLYFSFAFPTRLPLEILGHVLAFWFSSISLSGDASCNSVNVFCASPTSHVYKVTWHRACSSRRHLHKHTHLRLPYLMKSSLLAAPHPHPLSKRTFLRPWKPSIRVFFSFTTFSHNASAFILLKSQRRWPFIHSWP